MTDCVVMIPARGGSKGIPAKNLQPLAGSPLVSWTIRQSLAANIGPTIVVTDDPEIAAASERHGVTVYEEPYILAADDVDLEPVMQWFLDQCRGRSGGYPQWLIMLQPTSSLKLSKHIEAAWAIAQTGAFDSIFSAVPSAHCSWRFDGTKWMPEWPQADPLRRMLRQHAGPQVTENGAIYLVRSERFLAEGTRFCGRYSPYEMPLWTAQEIDGPEELAIVEMIMRARLQLGADGVRT